MGGLKIFGMKPLPNTPPQGPVAAELSPTDTPGVNAKPVTAPPWLLDSLRQAIRVRHYSIRTEDSYVDCVRRLILFHGKRHPSELGAAEVAEVCRRRGRRRTLPSANVSGWAARQPPPGMASSRLTWW